MATVDVKVWLAGTMLVVALFEFWTIMQVFGRKPKDGARGKLMLSMHRLGGYVYLVLLAALIWIGFMLLRDLSRAGGYSFDGRRFFHALIGVSLFVVLLLKLAFVRIYRNYRRYAQLLGFILAGGTLVVWAVAAWMYIAIVGGVQVE